MNLSHSAWISLYNVGRSFEISRVPFEKKNNNELYGNFCVKILSSTQCKICAKFCSYKKNAALSISVFKYILTPWYNDISHITSIVIVHVTRIRDNTLIEHAVRNVGKNNVCFSLVCGFSTFSPFQIRAFEFLKKTQRAVLCHWAAARTWYIVYVHAANLICLLSGRRVRLKRMSNEQYCLRIPVPVWSDSQIFLRKKLISMWNQLRLKAETIQFSIKRRPSLSYR